MVIFRLSEYKVGKEKDRKSNDKNKIMFGGKGSEAIPEHISSE